MTLPRSECRKCGKSQSTCYCALLVPYPNACRIIFLVHPKEARRPIATARMAHLNLKHSEFIVGAAFEANEMVNRYCDSESFRTFLLFPGEGALALDNDLERSQVMHSDLEKPIIFIVIDGTWAMAKKTLRESRNLRSLPRVSFQSTKGSQFKIRRQPFEYCLSTIETVDRLLYHCESNFNSQMSDRFLAPFHHMVDQQISLQERFSPGLHSVSRPR